MKTEVLIKFDRILDEVEQEFLERLIDDHIVYSSISFTRLRPPKVYIEDAQPLTKEGIKKICENHESADKTGRKE